MKLEEFEPYFEGKKKLLPRPSDLSYFNWDTQTSTSNSSPNFQVIADNEAGLLFKNKRDRKVCVCVYAKMQRANAALYVRLAGGSTSHQRGLLLLLLPIYFFLAHTPYINRS